MIGLRSPAGSEFVQVMVSCFLLFVPGHLALLASPPPDIGRWLTIVLRVSIRHQPGPARMYLVSPQLPNTVHRLKYRSQHLELRTFNKGDA